MNERTLSFPEPAPVHNSTTPIWDLVIQDMKDRDIEGRNKYGTPLQAHNGRDALVDAYQESLDQSVYLRQEIDERPTLRPLSEWCDDIGDALWYRWPIQEPPWVGSPLCQEWEEINAIIRKRGLLGVGEDWYTHWWPLPVDRLLVLSTDPQAGT